MINGMCHRLKVNKLNQKKLFLKNTSMSMCFLYCNTMMNLMCWLHNLSIYQFRQQKFAIEFA